MAPGARVAELVKIRIEGAAPIRVVETAGSALAGFTATGSWSETGQIVFSGSSAVIQRVSAAGGPLTAATALDPSRAEQTHVQPVWLPGGRGVPRLSPDGSRVAYAAIDEQSGQRDIWIGDLKRGTRTRLTLARGYEALVRTAIHAVKPAQIAAFLGRKQVGS